MDILIPNSRYLFFVLLFCDFLKMVLPLVFDFISDCFLYKFFCLLQFRIILRSFKSTKDSSHLVCFCFLHFRM